MVIVFLVMLYKTKKIKYNKLLNPIVVFGPFLLTAWILFRIGVVTSLFYPSAMTESSTILGYFTSGSYMGIIGTIPEMLIIG